MTPPDALSSLPPIPKALVERLEEIYPTAAPRLDDPDRLIWKRLGEVDVVQFLRREYDFQQQRESSSL